MSKTTSGLVIHRGKFISEKEFSTKWAAWAFIQRRSGLFCREAYEMGYRVRTRFEALRRNGMVCGLGATKEELKPCPFCGTDSPTMIEGRDVAPKMPWFLTCRNDDCEADGPLRYSEKEAIAAWNLRSEPAGKEGTDPQ